MNEPSMRPVAALLRARLDLFPDAAIGDPQKDLALTPTCVYALGAGSSSENAGRSLPD